MFAMLLFIYVEYILHLKPFYILFVILALWNYIHIPPVRILYVAHTVA